jgi:hypothetical protein
VGQSASLEIIYSRFPIALETIHAYPHSTNAGKLPVTGHSLPPPPLKGRPHRRPRTAVPLHVGVRVPGSSVQGHGAVQGGGSGGETVSGFNVVVAGRGGSGLTFCFDKPLGQESGGGSRSGSGEDLPDPGGSWKWQTTNALRFQPSGGLPVASEYKVELDPAKIVKEGAGLYKLKEASGPVPPQVVLHSLRDRPRVRPIRVGVLDLLHHFIAGSYSLLL